MLTAATATPAGNPSMMETMFTISTAEAPGTLSSLDGPGLLGFFANIGYTEVLIILAVLLLVFGTRLPSVAKSLGKGISEFKRGLSGKDDTELDRRDDPQP